jgi:membrane protein
LESNKTNRKRLGRGQNPRLGAALAYYTVFSLPGVLFISMAIAGAVFGANAALGHIISQLQDLLGEEGAKSLEEIIVTAQRPGKGLIASLAGLIVLLFAASGVFGELQDGLNTIWDVAPKAKGGVWRTIRNRFLSFTMVLGSGFLLLVSLVLSTLLSALGKWTSGTLPGPTVLLQLGNQAVSFAVVTILFAMMFKVLPDAKIHWRDVWMGAVATAFFFTVGKFVLGLYLGRAAVGSAYGAAGSFVVLLVWIYYSAQILYLGAEFTQSYARMYGAHISIRSESGAID